MLNSSSSARNSRSPFTITQWQELEHQALIYKYMISGLPIPPELLYSVKRSLETSLASRLFPHQQPIGWGFQVGFGRKVDPEPGRCRRTDGKKWRCSKEAYPDSKYCEKHMHRGRNRSRKTVEHTQTCLSTTSAITIASQPSSSINKSSYAFPSYSLSSSMEPEIIHAHQNQNTTTFLNPFNYHQSACPKPPGSCFSAQNNLFLEHSSSSDKDYRYFHGVRDSNVDERAFFPESSPNARSLQDSYPQSTMSSYKDQSQQEQHCFVLGTDFKSSSTTTRPTTKSEKDQDQTQKPLHHFFGEWPPKNTDSWLDLASSSSSHWYIAN